MTKYTSSVCGIVCLSVASACNSPSREPKADSKQPAANKSGDATSSAGNTTEGAGTDSHLLDPPAGYVLIAKCDRIMKKLPPDWSQSMSSNALPAAALLAKAVAVGKVSLCSERFAPQGISVAVRANIIEEARVNCEDSEFLSSSKLSITSPKPCAPPVTGEQTIYSERLGSNVELVTVKMRYSLNVANLSNQEKDVLKKGWAELIRSDSPAEQRRVTPDLE